MSDEFDPTQGYVSDEEREALRVEHAELEQEKRARESVEFWQAVFSTDTGRREMFGILAHLNTFGHPFAVGPNGTPQPEASMARFGAQAAGLALYHKWLRANPEPVNLMYLESVR
jgi:hypothetical protein